MATIDGPHPIHQAHPFRANARFYAPAQVIALLREIARVPALALVVDVDALERSAAAKVDRVMTLALDALSHADVQIVLLSRHDRARAGWLHRGIPRSWSCTNDGAALANLRERLPDVRVIAISDDPELLRALVDRDRGIALGGEELAAANIAATDDASLRAALWWLVDVRSRVAP